MTTLTLSLVQNHRRSPSKGASVISRLFATVTNARCIPLVIALLGLAACSDAPTASRASIDRVAAARVMPSITDARVRIAPGIDNAVIRARVLHDLESLEIALANGDGDKARFHVGILGTVLKDYKTQLGTSTTDGPEVSALTLMLYAVSDVVAGHFELPVI
jgi:hypothetical protein